MDTQVSPQVSEGGDEITALINHLERQLDEAFLTSSKLAVIGCNVSIAANIPIRAGQPFAEQIGRTIALITEARGQAVAAHRSAERIARVIGYGDGERKPEGRFFEALEPAPLELVAQAA